MCESDYYDDDCLLDDMIEDASIYFDKEQSDLKQNNMTIEEAQSLLQPVLE